MPSGDNKEITMTNINGATIPEGSALAQAIASAAEKAAGDPAPEASKPAPETQTTSSTKMAGMIDEVYYRPAGGAQTFDEYDRYVEAENREMAVRSEYGTFELLVGNVLTDVNLSPAERAERLASLAAEAAPRIREAEAEAGRKEVEAGEKELTGFDMADPGAFRAFRDKSGDLRWVAIHSNKYEDREREIFSAKAHEEFVQWADEYKSYPGLRLWHIPVDIGDGDYVAFDGDFMISSGTFKKEYEGVGRALAASKEALGCSHGYQWRPWDLRDGVYERYRSFEVSVLPLKAAANELTAFFAKGDMPVLNEAKREFLKQVGGDSLVTAVEQSTSAMKSLAEQSGRSYKDLVDGFFGEVEGAKDDAAAVTVTEPATVVTDAEAVAAAAAAAPAPEATATTPAPEAAATAPAPEAAAVTPAPEAAAATAPAPEAEKALDPNAALLEGLKSILKPLQESIDSLVEVTGNKDAAVAAAVRPRNAADRAVAHSLHGQTLDPSVGAALKSVLGEPESGSKDAGSPVADYVGMLSR